MIILMQYVRNALLLLQSQLIFLFNIIANLIILNAFYFSFSFRIISANVKHYVLRDRDECRRL